MNSNRFLSGSLACLLLLAGCKRESATSDAPRPTEARKPSPRPVPTTAPVADRDVEPRVFQIVAEQTGVKRGELTRATNLKRDLKADELDTVELVMELEDTFGMSIPDNDADKLKTVGELVDYVRTHRTKP